MDPLAVALKLVLFALAHVGAPAEAARAPSAVPQLHPAPVGFVENRGQWPEEVRFFARTHAAEVTLLDDAMVFRGAEGVVTVRFPGAASTLEGQAQLDVRTSYLGRGRRTTGVGTYGSVRYSGLAPGIDLLVRPDGASFAYDLLLAPSADLDAFVFGLEGAIGMEKVDDVRLRVLLQNGAIEKSIGACWQIDPATGGRAPVDLHYKLSPDGDPRSFGFHAPGWDSRLPLVIDPTLLYCTYLGSAEAEDPRAISVDDDGNVYVAARTTPAMPTTPGALQVRASPVYATWVGKLTDNGSNLEWATFLDGSETDQPFSIHVESTGAVVVVGQTWSDDFPLLDTGHQTTLNGTSDVFVVRIDASGSQLLHSTLFGGSNHDGPHSSVLLPDGSVVVALGTASADVEATSGAFDVIRDPPDKLIVRFSADLSQVVFATWFRISRVNALATDADGNVYFAGDSSVATGPVPVTPGAFQTVPGDTKDGVVGKLDPTGSELIWCTYVGGSKADTIWGMDVDETRAVYVVGQTVPNVSDFPTTLGAFSNLPAPTGNGFVSKVLADGSGLVWSTYIGGNGGGGGFLEDCAIDAAGNVTVVGWQNQPGWPTTPDALMPNYVGGFPSSDLVVTKFDATGSTLVHSTFFGGNSSDYPAYLAMDPLGRPHIAWMTFSPDLPVTPGAYQPDYLGNSEIGLAAFDLPMMPWRLSDSASKDAPYIPNLVGLGDLQPGSNTRLSVRGGKPFGLAWLVLGLAEWSLPLPLYGSVLYPSPDFLLPFQLGPSGELDLNFPAPPGTGDLHFQLIGFEPTAPGLLYASNGLRTAKE